MIEAILWQLTFGGISRFVISTNQLQIKHVTTIGGDVEQDKIILRSISAKNPIYVWEVSGDHDRKAG